MRISELARRAQVSVECIRFYERSGLLAQPRKPASGYRVYSQAHLERIRFLKRCQSIGFSLTEAGEIAEILRDAEGGCQNACGVARRKLKEIRERMAALSDMAQRLEALLDTEDRGKDCRLLNELLRR